MKNLKLSKKAILTLSAVCLISLNGCGNQDDAATSGASEDSSTSGTAASAVGGALSGSSSSGTLAFNSRKQNNGWLANLERTLNSLTPSANASGSECATFKTANGEGCTQNSDSSLWLTYSDCEYPGSAASYTGTQALIASSGTAVCGTFPAPTNGTLIRQLVDGAESATPSSGTVVTLNGTTITVDNATANLGLFDTGATVSTLGSTSGYGAEVTFASGLRTNLDIAEHITAVGPGGSTLYNHSVTGSISVSDDLGTGTQMINGDLKVYHNILRIIGTSSFNNVKHENGCCFPIEGTVTTTFSAGVNVTDPTLLGEAFVGRSESLTFTGCGTATYTDIYGNSSDVTLNHCI